MIERVGAAILAALAWVGDVSLFGLRALRDAFRPPFEFGEIARHIYEIGWRSAPLISVSGFAIGVVLSLKLTGTSFNMLSGACMERSRAWSGIVKLAFASSVVAPD